MGEDGLRDGFFVVVKVELAFENSIVNVPYHRGSLDNKLIFASPESKLGSRH